MKVRLIRCGPYANQSERHACEYLKTRLIGQPGEAEWVLLTNLSSSSGIHGLSEEFDLLVLGPTGAFPIEIKHWDRSYLRPESERAEHEAHKLNAKVRRLASHLRRVDPSLGFVAGRLLLTKNESEKFAERGGRDSIAGVEVFGLTEWADLIQLTGPTVLQKEHIVALGKGLEPRAAFALDDTPRVFGEYFDLQPVTGGPGSFHRVFQAKRRPGRDRVFLHVYDLTASKAKNARDLARREFDSLQRLQKSRFLPSLMDSFQEAAQYPGEICFFSYVDSDAATLADRAADSSWSATSRIRAIALCLEALEELHGSQEEDARPQILHRGLTPWTIRIRSGGEPLLTGLQFARIEDITTIAGNVAPEFSGMEEYVAPEILAAGLSACSAASDVYSACSSLSVALKGATAPPGTEVLAALAKGLKAAPEERPSLAMLRKEIRELVEPSAEPSPTPVEFWDEDTVLSFRDRHYRVIQRLGTGSAGSTFRVMEVDPNTGEEASGPYVAKAITNSTVGQEATKAYARVRAQTAAPHLAAVLEVAREWRRGELTALLNWVEGQPLSDVFGVFPLYLEDLQEAGEDGECRTAMLWVQDLCEGLSHLHRAGLVHGDVSPKNIIVHGRAAVLTDYDLARTVGSSALGGTTRYCSPAVDLRHAIAPSDDLFALAATFYELLLERQPFESGLDKTRGFRWPPDRRPVPELLRTFLDRCVHPNAERRFASAADALNFLTQSRESTAVPDVPTASAQAAMEPVEELHDREIPWLRQLLTSFPSSPKGNAETRGLDSEFSRETYVETELDFRLASAVRDRSLGLVVLCGNAGDGKTAFLQNLARTIGCSPGHSAQRVWERTLADGLKLRANLDGSAAHGETPAVQVLTQFLEPFLKGQFPKDLVHLLAINDGPLLAWLEQAEDCWLTEQLTHALAGREGLDQRIRFIDFNERSLVGRANGEAPFVESLLERMLQSRDTWEPCRSCSAQTRCSASSSVRRLQDPQLGPRIRQRLVRALQAVHLRGEVHVTARSLRAALTYVFFGTDYCSDLHNDPARWPEAYFDRVFETTAPYRQGDLLAELVLLDPAIEAHPRIDRELLWGSDARGREYGGSERLASLRRRAYFEWSEQEILRVAGTPGALGLARGEHLDAFLRVAAGTDEDRATICSDLCGGIARLEDLPERAFTDSKAIPLRITPRTPTETVFWVCKARERFRLFAQAGQPAKWIESLHTHVVLRYSHADGRTEDLIIGAELFHLLMELRRGYQITDAASDDVFAHLSIFKQRLAQEDDAELFAWNPVRDHVYRVSATSPAGVREMVIAPVAE